MEYFEPTDKMYDEVDGEIVPPLEYDSPSFDKEDSSRDDTIDKIGSMAVAADFEEPLELKNSDIIPGIEIDKEGAGSLLAMAVFYKKRKEDRTFVRLIASSAGRKELARRYSPEELREKKRSKDRALSERFHALEQTMLAELLKVDLDDWQNKNLSAKEDHIVKSKLYTIRQTIGAEVSSEDRNKVCQQLRDFFGIE